MPRIVQHEASKGSQHWLQVLVNHRPEVFARGLAAHLDGSEAGGIEWLSPLREDGYAEYRDESFLERLGVTLRKRALSSFWPRGGPVWDGLGRTTNGELLLVEAKAHIPEALSTPSAASPKSLELIQRSLGATKRLLGCRSKVDWAAAFYQYTNRLAHLYLLRELNGLPAHLLFVSFVNAEDMDGPKAKEEWVGAYRLIHAYLGLRPHRLLGYAHHVFVDVRELI